ncbi:hypothetical protein BLNAU_5263 [Blattamonas nauphoetae]|uniref:Uncharacterized protein n=1 Tax=Blattamonas nauphoetae TaxID=2049346 RepID=A0ABQ9Y7W2_9EUKA|nr:hypothetical protein BLNAU_5263 [Blattamonas nauphoetae]
MSSLIINLEGHSTTIVPSWTSVTAVQLDLNRTNERTNDDDSLNLPLFLMRNSTIAFSFFHFDCGGDGALVATITSSSLEVRFCHITSNVRSSPFAVEDVHHDSGTHIAILHCTHDSTTPSCLLPLVNVSHSSHTADRTHTNTDNDNSSTPFPPSLIVSGIGLALSNAHFGLGTGPLLGSLASETDPTAITPHVRTSLVTSTLRNVSSSRPEQEIPFCPSLSQSVVGSVVASCSNHLYGTSIHSLDVGGSLLSVNSSFISCRVDPTNENKPFSTRSELSAAYSKVSFKLCTFKGCSTTQNGGAIISLNQAIDLSIDLCSFDSCSARVGGALFYRVSTSSTNSFALTATCFRSCSATQDSGILHLLVPFQLTISECVFKNGESLHHSGGLYCRQWDPPATGSMIANTLFESCAQTLATSLYGGGAINFDDCPKIRLSSVQFDSCTSNSDLGHCIFFNEQTPTLNTDSIDHCFSYGAPGNVLIKNSTGGNHSSHISTTLTSTTIQSLTAQSSETTAVLTITLNQTVSGKILVLLSNSEGELQTGTFPNIERLITFDITSAKVASVTVPIGNTGRLQLPLSDYKIISASLAGHSLTFPTDPIDGPDPGQPTPFLNQLTCTLDESHTEAIVTLVGKHVDDGDYHVTLSEGKSFYISLHTDPTGVTTGVCSLGRIGDETEWPEESTWTVLSVTGPSSDPIEIGSLPLITIPIAARLSHVDVERTDTAESGKVTLSFSSVELEKSKEYTMMLIADELPAQELTRTLNTTSDGMIPAMEEVLFPLQSNQNQRAQQMKYGMTYKVTSLQATGRTNSVQVSSGMIEIQAQSVRLVTINADAKPTSIKLVVSGSGFVSNQMYTVEVSGVLTGGGTENPHTRTFVVVASSPTSASSYALPLSNTDSTSLQFGCTYTVKTILDGTDEGIIVGTKSFSTPDPPPPTPRLTSASCSLDDSHTEATAHFEGRDFENGQYLVTFADGSSDFVWFSTDSVGGSTGSKYLGVIGSVPKWIEGTTWNVTKVKSESTPTMTIDINHPVSFTIPTVARLSGIQVSELDDSTKGRVTLSFSSVELEKGKEYTLTLVGQDALGELQTRTFTTTSSGTIEAMNEVLYPFETNQDNRDKQLKFGVLYKVTSLKATGRSNSVRVGSLGAQMPVEPTRVTDLIGGSLNGSKTEISFELTGRRFLSDTYLVTMVRDSFPIYSTSVTVNSEFSLTVRFEAGFEETSNSLQFGETYRLDQISGGIDTVPIPQTLFLSVPTPPVITSFSTALYGSYLSFSVSVEGSELPQGETYVVSGVGFKPFQLLFSDDGISGESPELTTGQGTSFHFNTTYSVSSIQKEDNSDEHILFPNAQSFTTPPGPTLTSISCDLDVSDANFVVLSLSGSDLPNGEYTLKLEGTTQQPITLTVSIASGVGTKIVRVYQSGEMEYQKMYSVERMYTDAFDVLIASSATRVITPSPPARITHAKCLHSVPYNHETILTLTGSSLPNGMEATVEVTEIDPNGNRYGLPITLTPQIIEDSTSIVFPVSMHPSQPVFSFASRYEVTSLRITDTISVLNPEVRFDVPNGPVRVTGTTTEIPSPTTIVVRVEGSEFIYRKTYTLIVSGHPSDNPSSTRHERSFSVTADSPTSAASAPLSLSSSSNQNLKFFHTYTITGITYSGSPGLVDGDITFQTQANAHVSTDVFVSRGGSSDASECGSSDFPCCSVYVSWTAIHLKESAETSPVLRIEMEAELGGLLDIGQLELEIRGREEKRGRLIVESGLEWEEEGREGGIEVDGGRLGLFDLVLVLPSLSLPLSRQRAMFAVSGNGQFESASVRIVGSNGDRIGVGFVGWRSGEAKITSLEMDGVSFDDGVCVVNGTSVTKVLSLRMESCSIHSTTTTNSPLILFSSSSPSSSFSLSSTHILHSHRIQRTASSHSPLVSISTAQKATTLSNCVFAEGGCVDLTGSLSDSILSLSLTSPSSSSLTLLACLVIDCSPPTTTGKAALTITTTTALARIRLESCWVEETAESGSVFPFVDGVPTLPPTRRLVYSTLSSKIGVLIERDSTVPVVVRKGTGMSACRLLVQQKQRTQLASLSNTEMNESHQN